MLIYDKIENNGSKVINSQNSAKFVRSSKW